MNNYFRPGITNKALHWDAARQRRFLTNNFIKVRGERLIRPVPLEHQYRGAVRAWRLWRCTNNDYRLYALVTNYIWRPGVNRCNQNFANNYDEGYGFHGFKSLEDVRHQESDRLQRWKLPGERWKLPGVNAYALGSFLAFGRITVAEYGLRSEYAIPEYLVFPPGDLDVEREMHTIQKAEHHNMKAISLEQALELKTGLVPFKTTNLEEVPDEDY